jgi:hypothetical protein
MAKTDGYAPRIKPQFDWSGSPGYVTPEEALALNYKYRMADLIYRYKNGQLGDSQLQSGLTQLLDHAEVNDPSTRSAILNHPYAKTPLTSSQAAPTEENPDAQEVSWGDALGEVWNAFANGTPLLKKQLGPSLTAFAILAQQKDFDLLEPLLGRDDVSENEISELRAKYAPLLQDLEQYGTEMTQAGEAELQASGYEAPKSVIGQAAESMTTFPVDATVGLVSAIPGAVAGAVTGAAVTGGNPAGAVTGAGIGGRASGQAGLQMYTAFQLAGETLSSLESSKEYQQLANALKAKYGWNDAKIKEELLPKARNTTARSTYNERLVSLNSVVDALSGVAVPGFLKKVLLDAGTGSLSEAGDTVLQGVGRNKGLIQVAEELNVKEEFLNSGQPILTDFLEYGAANLDEVTRSAQVGAVAEGATSVITSAAEQKLTQGAEAQKVQDDIATRALKLAQEREKLEQARLKTAAAQQKLTATQAPNVVPNTTTEGVGEGVGEGVDQGESTEPASADTPPVPAAAPQPDPAGVEPETQPEPAPTKPKVKKWTTTNAQSLDDANLAQESDNAFNQADAADAEITRLQAQRDNTPNSESDALTALDAQIATLEKQRDFHSDNAEVLGEEKARRDSLAAGSRESSLAPAKSDGQISLQLPQLTALRDALRERYTGLTEDDFVLTQTAEEASQLAGYTIPNNVEGLYGTDGKIYLIGDQIRGNNLRNALRRGVKVAFHEGIGHREVMEIMGDDYRGWADNIYQTRKKDVNNWYKKRYNVDDATLAAEETQGKHTPDRRVDEWLAQNWTEDGVRETALIDNFAIGLNKVFRGKRVSDAEILKTYSKIEKGMRKGVVPNLRAVRSRTNIEEEKRKKTESDTKKAAETETATPERDPNDVEHSELQTKLDDIDTRIGENERLRNSTKVKERKAYYQKRIDALKQQAQPLIQRQEELETENPELAENRRTERQAAAEETKQKRSPRQRRQRPAEKLKEATKKAKAPAKVAPEAKEPAPKKETPKESTTKTPAGARFSQISELNLKRTTPEFRQWFSGSKVTNKNNNPMLMFHGSPSGDIERFGPYNFGLFGQGYYFTNNPKVASTYALKGTPTVYPVYLSIKNPMNMDQAVAYNRWRRMFENDPELLADVFPAKKPAYIKTNADAFEEIVNWYAKDNTPDYEVGERLMVGFEKEGIDGLTHRGGGRVKKDSTRHRVFIALDPDQIKFAYSKDIKDFEALDAQEAKDFEDAFAEIAKQTPRFSERLSGPDAGYYRPRFFDTIFGREQLVVEAEPQRADFDEGPRGDKKFNKAMDRFRKTQLPERGTAAEYLAAIRKKAETAPAELSAKNELKRLIEPALQIQINSKYAGEVFSLAEIRSMIESEIPKAEVYTSLEGFNADSKILEWAANLSTYDMNEESVDPYDMDTQDKDQLVSKVLTQVVEALDSAMDSTLEKLFTGYRMIPSDNPDSIELIDTLNKFSTSLSETLATEFESEAGNTSFENDFDAAEYSDKITKVYADTINQYAVPTQKAVNLARGIQQNKIRTPKDFAQALLDEGILNEDILFVTENPRYGHIFQYNNNGIDELQLEDVITESLENADILDRDLVQYDASYYDDATGETTDISIYPTSVVTANNRWYIYTDLPNASGELTGDYDSPSEALTDINNFAAHTPLPTPNQRGNVSGGTGDGDFEVGKYGEDYYPIGVDKDTLREIVFRVESPAGGGFTEGHWDQTIETVEGYSERLGNNAYAHARIGEVNSVEVDPQGQYDYMTLNPELEGGLTLLHFGEGQSEWQSRIDEKGVKNNERAAKLTVEVTQAIAQLMDAEEAAKDLRRNNSKYQALARQLRKRYQLIATSLDLVDTQFIRFVTTKADVPRLTPAKMKNLIQLLHVPPKSKTETTASRTNAPETYTFDMRPKYNGYLGNDPLMLSDDENGSPQNSNTMIEQMEGSRVSGDSVSYAAQQRGRGIEEFRRAFADVMYGETGIGIDNTTSRPRNLPYYAVLSQQAPAYGKAEHSREHRELILDQPFYKELITKLTEKINEITQAPTAYGDGNGLSIDELKQDARVLVAKYFNQEKLDNLVRVYDTDPQTLAPISMLQDTLALKVVNLFEDTLDNVVAFRGLDEDIRMQGIQMSNTAAREKGDEFKYMNRGNYPNAYFLTAAADQAGTLFRISEDHVRIMDALQDLTSSTFAEVDANERAQIAEVERLQEEKKAAMSGENPMPIGLNQKDSTDVYSRIAEYLFDLAFQEGKDGVVLTNGDQIKAVSGGEISGQRAYYNTIYPSLIRKSPIYKYMTEVEVPPTQVGLDGLTAERMKDKNNSIRNSKKEQGKTVFGNDDETNTVYLFPKVGTPKRDALENLIAERKRDGTPLFSELPQDASRANRVSLAIRRFFNPYAELEEADEYRKLRNQTMGKIGNLEQGFRKMADVLSTATRDESKVLYEILTTRDEDRRRELETQLRTPGLVSAVNEARDAISETGQMLLDAGLLTDEQLAANEGRYVPNLYLKYLLNEEDSRRFIGGKSVSRMNYLKARKNQTVAMVMDLIKDPALLSAKATIEPRRDLALLNLFESISQNDNWAREDSLVTVNYADLIEDIVDELGLDYDQLEGIDRVLDQEDDKQLGAFFLEEEAKRLRNDVAPRRDGQMRQLVNEFANRLDALVDEAKREAGDYEPADWQMVPKQARYGAFQGMVIRKEIYDDLIGSVVFANNTVDRWAQNANVIWKWGKVAANIPSWMRNFYSNSMMMHLAGMPIWSQPGYLKRAFQMIYDDQVNGTTDPIFQQFKDAGMVKTTFGANELQRIQREFALNSKLNEDGTPKTGVGEYLSDMEFMLQKVFNFMGDRYQDIEVMSKLAYGMYMMDKKGMDAKSALLASAEPLFDYGEVDNSIRLARRYPIGTPFITWLYKATPFLYKTMTSREGLMRMAPILAMHYGMYFATTGAIEGMMQTEWDDEDRERFLQSQQKWIQKAGPFAMVLPWKDENGNIQIVDTTYLLPYATHAQALQSLVRAATDEASKDNVIDILASFGLGGAPLLQLASGLLWNYDSFRQRELVNDYDDPATHWYKKVVYAYDTMAPAMLSSTGVFSTLIEASATAMGSPTSPGPLNLFAEYALGIPPTVSNMYNREGEQKRTLGQAAMRAAGINVNAYDIGDEREKRFNTLQYQRRMLRTNYRNEVKALRKAGASDADIRKRRDAFNKQDQKLRERIRTLRGSTQVLDDAFYPSAGAYFSEMNPL